MIMPDGIEFSEEIIVGGGTEAFALDALVIGTTLGEHKFGDRTS